MAASGIMFPDGSNPEGVDPVPALGWSSVADLKNVVVYGMPVSPPCCKLLAYLARFEIEYKFVRCMVKPKDKHYKRIPVIVVDGRQVNDTGIIVKNLMKACAPGEPIDQEWEDRCSYAIGPSIEMSLSHADLVKWASMPNGVGAPGCMISCLKRPMLNFTKRGIQKSLARPGTKWEIGPIKKWGTMFAEELGDSQFLGGERPGQVDISFYGVHFPFYNKHCQGVRQMIQECGLTAWWHRMELVIPPNKIHPGK